jgi:predicted MPP superfamily phosphohydrolase
MSALILHLSDLHMEDEADPVALRSKAIAGVLNPYLPAAYAVFIAVSGDIGQSGRKEEYEVAARLLKKIKAEIKNEKDIPVEFVMVPGNHDCDFSEDQAVRNAILKDLSTHVGNMPSSLIELATEVQRNYFNFRQDLISHSSLLHDDPLWTVQEFVVEGKTIWFDSLNAAWMSTKIEKPGAVFFPFEAYKDSFKPGDADMRIGVMHHPLNWFGQINYQNFRTFVQTLNDVVISGHEHSGNAGVRSDARGDDCVYIEGCALQVKRRTQSAFNVIELRFDPDQIGYEKYELNGDRYEGTSEQSWFPMRPLPLRAGSELDFVHS